MRFSSSRFASVLEPLYLNDLKSSDAWTQERETVLSIVNRIKDDISHTYDITVPFRIGGTGILCLVNDKRLGRERILKFARPVHGKERTNADILHNEVDVLLRLDHPHIVSICSAGVVTLGDDTLPYYIMETIEEGKDLESFFRTAEFTDLQLLTFLDGLFAGLEYVHSKNILHMDINPANILVSPNCEPKVLDFGLSIRLDSEQFYSGRIGGTQGYIHPSVYTFVSNLNAGQSPGGNNQIKPSAKWDLYGLGKTCLRILAILEERNVKTLSAYQKRYLRLLACRLLDGQNTSDEEALQLPRATLSELCYSSATDSRVDLNKLAFKHDISARIPELSIHCPDSIQVTTVSSTPFTPRVKLIVEHWTLARLGSVTQLGLLNLVYPTASHSRLEHSLGTFSVLCRFVLALYNDEINPLFRQLMNEEDLQAVLLCGLLHDIGQYPLAHDLEEADFNFFSHVELTRNVLKADTVLKEIINHHWQTSVDRVVDVLDADPTDASNKLFKLKDRILHSLIDGPIDADKIDYLVRDSQRLGLAYGRVIDLTYILKCITIVFRSDKRRTCTYASLGIHEKGKVPAEAICFARYAMFGAVYWHHAYRSIKAMLHRVVWEMLESSRDRTRLRNEFRTFVCPSVPPEDEQLDMFVERSIAETGPTGQIQAQDASVLRWMENHSTEIGKSIIKLLWDRKLYKRVLVLSLDKSSSDSVFSNIHKAQGLSRTNKLKLHNEMQRLIRNAVLSDSIDVNSITIDGSIKTRFIADAEKFALVLVDVPPDRSDQQSQLDFLVEEDRRFNNIDELKSRKVWEKSMIYDHIKSNFVASIGKIRVFVHPTYYEFVSAAISPDVLETMLKQALKSVLKPA